MPAKAKGNHCSSDLQPSLHPSSDGLHPSSDGLPETSLSDSLRPRGWKPQIEFGEGGPRTPASSVDKVCHGRLKSCTDVAERTMCP